MDNYELFLFHFQSPQFCIHEILRDMFGYTKPISCNQLCMEHIYTIFTQNKIQGHMQC